LIIYDEKYLTKAGIRFRTSFDFTNTLKQQKRKLSNILRSGPEDSHLSEHVRFMPFCEDFTDQNESVGDSGGISKTKKLEINLQNSRTVNIQKDTDIDR
jgi:hypothetical protein